MLVHNKGSPFHRPHFVLPFVLSEKSVLPSPASTSLQVAGEITVDSIMQRLEAKDPPSRIIDTYLTLLVIEPSPLVIALFY